MLKLKKVSFYLGISIFWLPLSMLFDGINTLFLPARISGFVDRTHQASILGLLSFVGLLAGLLVQPIAGAFSDNWRSRVGRKGLLAVGVALTLVFLTLFALAGSLAFLAAAFLLVQVSGSVTQAAQQGLIPDLVPASHRGKVSGWKAFMDIGGATVGFVLLGQLLGRGRAGLAAATIGLGLVTALILTVLLVREERKPRPALEERNAGKPATIMAEAFRLDLKKHRSFAWLVISRFLFLLGIYAVGRFLLYFVANRLGLRPNEAAKQAGSLLAGLALATAIGAPFAGWLADRWRRRPVILFGSLISALGVFLLIFASSSAQIFLFGIMMSLGSAAFTSANWALTADLVPKEESARYFGLANIGTAGAAAAAGLFGPLVDWVNAVQSGVGYPALFIASSAALALSALVLGRVDRAFPPEQPEAMTMFIREA